MGDKGEEGVITHKSKKIGDVIYGWPIPIIFYKCTSGMHFSKEQFKNISLWSDIEMEMGIIIDTSKEILNYCFISMPLHKNILIAFLNNSYCHSKYTFLKS